MEPFDDVETMALYPTSIPGYDTPNHPVLAGYDPHVDHFTTFEVDSFTGDFTPPEHHYAFQHPANYEDAYSETFSNYDQPCAPEPPLPDSNVALDRDNKLLSFTPPSFSFALLDYTYRRASIALTAQLNGMFFLTDPPTSSGDDGSVGPLAVTCYRRNLFSISGNIALPRSFRYISADNGEQVPVVSQELALSATESIEGTPVKLISVPFKSSMVTGGIEEKADKEPHSIPIDLMSGADMDPEIASFPVAWKRLQFRSSTANNGRRKELQQHFQVRISVMATLSTGQKVSICEVMSNPIVVRGRSPRNFQNKKEAPTSGAINGKKPGIGRTISTDSHGLMPPIKHETSEPLANPDDLIGINSDAWNLQNENQPANATPLPGDTFQINPTDFMAKSSPDLPHKSPSNRRAPAGKKLSILDDDFPKPLSSPSEETPTRKAPRLSNRAPSFSLSAFNTSEHGDESKGLYTYKSLTINDWQPPVDGVYRPHLVHHVNYDLDFDKFGVGQRYFAKASS